MLVIHIDDLISTARGKLSESRAAIVRNVWEALIHALDFEGRGSVRVKDLLATFDGRQLHCCRFGALTAPQARLELLEGLGLEGWTTPEEQGGWQWSGEFCMDEVTAGRRAKPIGAPGKPMHAPAGKPGAQRAGMRPVGDVTMELRGQPRLVKEDVQVTYEDFEAYYTALSTAMVDDTEFKDTVERPWLGAEVHAKAEALRTTYEVPLPSRKPAIINIMTTFEDGSRRKVVLENDIGLAESLKRAGTDNGQLWSWGRDVYPEIARRLQSQGVKGIKSFSVMVG